MPSPEDEGRRIADRAIQYRGQNDAIMVQALLETFESKGAARRAMGTELPPLTDPLQSWVGRITAGLAGAHPALPNAVQCKRPWWRRWFR